MNLWADFLSNDGRIIDKWKHYFPAYERHFARYVNRPLTFLEIGCGEGGSLQMWKRYFGPHARLIGIDVRPQCAAFEEDQIAIRIGDQADPVFLDQLIEEFGTPDIVLDDGSHIMQHVVATFGFLFHRTAPDGVYMVEDLHTAYWEQFGGGLQRPGTFIELCKTLVDEMNADWTRGALPPTEFTRSTLSMHFYDSLVAFERGRTTRKTGFRIGRET
ncbi:class I SAM-dependent methyltransferase [Rhodopila sp.]|uniref:class I SAM-dependent methyltransferase n=1 Tax=Rhodopila sp. TaxID=2480087 RepID=UPI003D0A2E87